MEPMVVFSVALVIYCGWLSWLDALRDRQQRRAPRIVKVRQRKLSPAPGGAIPSSGRGRGDGGGGHWPALAKGSA